MASRADILGDEGTHHPEHWIGGLGTGKVHAIAILFARDSAERERCVAAHRALVERCDGVEVLSFLDLEATPPFEYAHDHFGYRDRLSQPVVEGSGDEPTPGSGAPLKAGRVHSRLPRRGRSARRFTATRRARTQRNAIWPTAAWKST